MDTVRASACGHPAITATHQKTLEVSREADIGREATCVIGVSGALDEQALARLRGIIELTISAGGRSAVVRGRANPAFRPGDPLVVRRDPAITRDAILVEADIGAAGLDRELVAALAERGAAIELTFREVAGSPPAGVLVVGVDEGWTTGEPDPGGFDLAAGSPIDAKATDAIAHALRCGEKVLLRRSLSDTAAMSVVRDAHASGHAVVPRAGLAPIGAALAVAGVPVEAVEFATHDRHRPQELPHGATRVTAGVPGDCVLDHLGCGDVGLIVLDAGTPREEFLSWRDGEQPVVAGGRRRVALVVAHRFAQTTLLDETSHAYAVAMLEEGLPIGDIARVIATVSGHRRRDVYNHLLRLKDSGA
jgi:hypothetical protein